MAPPEKRDQHTSSGMRFVFVERTYAGSVEHPDHNEDATLILGDSRSAAVFDGLGGGDRGEEASGIAREVFAQLLRNLPPDITEEEATLLQVNQPLGDGEVDPRIILVDIQLGDRILLTTDGIHDNLTSAEIAALLDDSDPDGAAEALIAAARERSVSSHFRAKPDDMSVVVIDTRT